MFLFQLRNGVFLALHTVKWLEFERESTSQQHKQLRERNAPVIIETGMSQHRYSAFKILAYTGPWGLIYLTPRNTERAANTEVSNNREREPDQAARVTTCRQPGLPIRQGGLEPWSLDRTRSDQKHRPL
jgi:hypothetical protein